MKIRTVTGDVPAEKMGRTLTHEHLLYTYPGGEYDHQSSFDLDQAVSRIATERKEGRPDSLIATWHVHYVSTKDFRGNVVYGASVSFRRRCRESSCVASRYGTGSTLARLAKLLRIRFFSVNE